MCKHALRAPKETFSASGVAKWCATETQNSIAAHEFGSSLCATFITPRFRGSICITKTPALKRPWLGSFDGTSTRCHHDTFRRTMVPMWSYATRSCVGRCEGDGKPREAKDSQVRMLGSPTVAHDVMGFHLEEFSLSKAKRLGRYNVICCCNLFCMHTFMSVGRPWREVTWDCQSPLPPKWKRKKLPVFVPLGI